jgi:hypothetical protein
LLFEVAHPSTITSLTNSLNFEIHGPGFPLRRCTWETTAVGFCSSNVISGQIVKFITPIAPEVLTSKPGFTVAENAGLSHFNILAPPLRVSRHCL